MSKSIDNKVVSMEFDNSKFESNVKTSMNTIDKLKQSLNFDDVPKGFEKIESESRKVSMSGLSGAVEDVKLRFSALEVMAVTALANITNSAIETGKRLVSSLTIDQITAGWSKYEQKTASVQTIMNATGKSIDEVNEYLNKLMWFSDETSYSFTDMTSSLAQLTSAGADIDKIIPMIEGIANATAYAGKGTAEFSRAIYNLNQSYSAGSLQYMDWKSLELAGVASKELKQVIIDTAIELGKLGANGEMANGELVSIANFGTTLKEKWADTEVMEKAFGKFSELTTAAYEAVQAGEFDTASEAIQALSKDYDELAVKAFQSAQEAKSFTEAIEATKDAVSSGWLRTFEIIFGNYEEAKVLWTDLANTMWDMFASGAEQRNAILDSAMSSKWTEFSSQLKEAGVSVDDFEAKLKSVASTHGHSIEQMIEEQGSLKAVFDKGLIPKTIIIETLEQMAEVGEAHTDLTKKLEEFQKITKRVWYGEFGNGAERMEKLAEAGYDYAEVQELVNKTVNGYELTLEDLSDAQLESIGYTEEEISQIKELARQSRDATTPIGKLVDAMTKPTGRELFTDTLNKSLEIVIQTLDIVKTAWSEVYGTITAEDIYGALEKVNKFTNNTLNYINENFDKFRDSLKGIFAAIDIVVSFVGSTALTTIKRILKILGYANTDILTITQSLGLAIVRLRDWINEHKIITGLYGVFLDYVTDFIKLIYDWIKAFVQMPEVERNLRNIADVMKDLSFAGVKSFFNGGIDKVKDFVKGLKGMDKVTFKGLKTEFASLGKNLFGYFTDFSNLSPNFKKAFSTLTADLGVGLDNFKNKFSGFKIKFEPILQWFKDKLPKDLKISVGNILAIGIGAALIKLMNGLTKALSKVDDIIGVFTKLAGAVSSFVSSINGVLAGLKNIELAYTKKLKSEAFMNIAKSILMIAAAIAVLAMLDTKKMLIAAGALAAVMCIMILLASKIGKMENGVNIAVSAGSILALAGAILILSIAFKSLSKLEWSEVLVGLAGLSGCVAAMWVLMKACGKFSAGMTKDVLVVIGIAVGVRILAMTLKALSKLEWSEVWVGLVGLAGCVAAMAALLLICRKIDATSALPAIAAAAALLVLAISFKMIAKLKTETILDALVNMLGIMAVLIPLFVTIRLAGKEAIKSGGSILAISAALILIAVAMKILATLNNDELTRATIAITVIIGILSAMIVCLGIMAKLAGAKGKVAGAALTIAAMGVAIVAIAAAMLLLGAMTDEKLNRSLAVVATILGMFALIIAASGLSKDCYKTIIGIAVIIGILAIALSALSMIPDQESLKTATMALSVLMGMLAVVIATTGLASKAMGTIIVLGVVVGLLAALIGHLQSLDMAPSIESASALGILMISLSASMAIMSLCRQDIMLKAIATLGILGVAITLIGALIGHLENLNLAPSIETATALSILIVALSAAAVLCSLAGAAGAAGFIGVGILAALVAAIGVLLAAFAGINELMGEANLAEFLNNGIPILQAIGEGLGRFVGAFVGGMARGLVGTGKELSDFMDNLKGFIAGCGSITPEVANGMKSLSTALLALTGAKFIDGLGRFFGKRSSLKELGEGLEDFAPYMAKFAKAMKDVDSADLKKGCDAFKMISDAASNLGRHDGWMQKIKGDNKISDFVQMLADCFYGKDGEGSFQKFVKGLNSVSGEWDSIESNSKSFVGILGIISEFADTLAAHDGLLQFVKGDNKISDFVGMLAECLYGKNGNGSFQKYVSGLDGVSGSWEAIKTNTQEFISILGDMSSFADTLSTHGGISSWFNGDNTISKFVEMLNVSLSDFANYARQLESISKEVGLTTTKVRSQEVRDALIAMASVSEAIPENYSKIFTGNPISKITSDLSAASYNLKTFVANMSGITGANLSDLGTGISSLISSVTTLTEENNAKLSEFTENLLKLGRDAITSFVNALNDNPEELEASGKALADSCLRGVESKKNDVVKSANTTFTSFNNGLHTISNYNTMRQTGQYLVQGFIDGINSKTEAAKSAARSLGNATNAALKNSLAEKSPSKITHQFGEYYVDGFINGIKENIQNAANISRTLGEDSVNSLRSSIKKISDAVSSDVDTQPTIKPVLDLSEIEAGKNKLNGMMSNINPVGKLNASTSFALANSTGAMPSQVDSSISMNFNIYGSEGQDVNELANIISQKINMSLNRRTSVWQ